MIRIHIHPVDPAPDEVRAVLKDTDQIQIAEDDKVADVFVLYAQRWNRGALLRVQALTNRGEVPIVMFCEQADEPFATDSILRRHICGIITPDTPNEQRAAILRAASSGLRILPGTRQQMKWHEPFTLLTPRELDILRLIADGEGNKTIAQILDISHHTVKFHISSIFEKLHASSRTEAVRAAISRGLISI